MRRSPLIYLGMCILVTACSFPEQNQLAASPAATNAVPELATPYALQPAAGICGQAEGQSVEIILEPGIPNPRCVQVIPSQFLMVTNRTGQFIAIGLGDERTGLGPGQSFSFDRPMGEMLALGVHQLYVDPCCGGEIVLVAP